MSASRDALRALFHPRRESVIAVRIDAGHSRTAQDLGGVAENPNLQRACDVVIHG